MTTVYGVNTYNKMSNGNFAISMTGTFDDSEQELFELKTLNPIQRIKSIMWCINTVGYVTLHWENHEDTPICVLSGNGKWEFTKESEIPVPAGSTGNIKLSTKGFDILDSYTIILSGVEIK